MTDAQRQLEKSKKAIDKELARLKALFNDTETSLRDMGEIADYFNLLNVTDFHKFIFD